MSGFAAEWLALREPLDLAARNREVEATFVKATSEGEVRILDLASGAGSTIAGLKNSFFSPLQWLLTDYDPALLEIAATRWREGAGCDVTTLQIDLADNLEKLSFSDADAITTSAFLDLVSENFLQRLVACVVRSGKPFLASLTYDGRAKFEPAHPFDGELLDALNRHQQTDKGFGDALGPFAAQRAVELFKAAGYKVKYGTSDWVISGSKQAFLKEFLSGWFRVGREVGLDNSHLEAWWLDRSRRIDAGELAMMVGHLDFAAYPARDVER